MTTFNLTTAPWLPVLTDTGEYHEVGLVDAFHNADQHSLAAGGGLLDAALHRFLLAIAYAALGNPTTSAYPATPEQIVSIADWLTANQQHFDLLDTNAPFAQDQTLAASTAPILPPSVLDPMVGKERPRITDWRSLDDEPTLSFAAAARLLIIQLGYGVGGRHKGSTDSFPESPLTGLITFRPTGLLTEQLAWARIPVASLGQPNWTWCTREDVGDGVRGSRPTGELDALTWLSRRFLLHHDGTQITGMQQALGWRRAPELDVNAPFDSGAGRHDIAVAASSTTKPAKAAAVSGRSWRASSGDPIDLSAVWERGGPDSLSHHLRAAVLRSGRTTPAVIATGHQIETKVLWAGQFTTRIPLPDRTITDRAAQISDARQAAHVFGNPTDADLLTMRLPDDNTDVEVLTEQLQPTRAANKPAPFWPTDTEPIWSVENTNDEDGDDLYAGLSPEAVKVIKQSRKQAAHHTPEATAVRLWRNLYQDFHHGDTGTTRHLADVTRTRVPTSLDFQALTDIDLTDAHLRLWAGLAATWIADTRHRRTDSSTPFPTALRRASAATNSRTGRDSIKNLTHTGTTATALRAPLLTALELISRVGHPPSWRSLHHDLTNWTPETVKHWTNAYWHGLPSQANTATTA